MFDRNEIDKSGRANAGLTPSEAEVLAGLLSKLLVRKAPDIDASLTAGSLACRAYDARRSRRHFFPEDLFADPAWDMLLLLYCMQHRRKSVTVSGLCASADVPTTTAFRWLRELESLMLVTRVRHPSDGRSYLIELSDSGREKMESYMNYVRERHLGLQQRQSE